MSVAMWALAASVVPAATCTGGWRKMPSTWAASKRRMRWRLRSLAIVVSRIRAALSGVGTVSHRSSSHSDAEIGFELEERRKIAPQLLAQAVGEAIALGTEILGDTRPLAQFDDDGIGDREQSEAARIGAQGRGHHFAVAAVVLGAGQGEAVAEAIHLLGVDGVDLEAALNQRLDHGAVRHLDRNMDLRRASDAPLVAISQAAISASPSPPCLKILFADFATIIVSKEHMMAFRPPSRRQRTIFSDRSCFLLPFEQSSRRDLSRSLYWRSESRHGSGADSPRGIDRGQFAGARVLIRWSGHRGRWVAPGE